MSGSPIHKSKCAECYYDGVCDRTVCRPCYPTHDENGEKIEKPFDPWEGEPGE